MKARRTVVIGTAVAFLAVSGCGSSDNESSSGSADQVATITIADSSTGQGAYLNHVIKHYKIDAKHGINFDMKELDFTAVPAALAADSVQLANQQTSLAFNLASSNDLHVQLLTGGLGPGEQWVVKSDSPYETMSDLRGKTVGNFAKTTAAYLYSKMLLQKEDLDLDTDFHLITSGQAGALVGLMERGDLEAVCLFPPYTTKLVSTGEYRVIADFNEQFEEYYGAIPMKSGFMSTKSWVDDNPDLVEKIQATVAEATNLIRDGGEKEFFLSAAPDLFGLTTKDPKELDAAYQANLENFLDPAGWSAEENTDVTTEVLKAGVELGLVPSPPSESYYTSIFEPMMRYKAES